jgi:hypothetical protein
MNTEEFNIHSWQAKNLRKKVNEDKFEDVEHVFSGEEDPKNQKSQMSKREALRTLQTVHANGLHKWDDESGRYYMGLLKQAMDALGAHEAWE